MNNSEDSDSVVDFRPDQMRPYSSLTADRFAPGYYPDGTLPIDWRSYGVDTNHRFDNPNNYNQSVNQMAQLFPTTNNPSTLLPPNYLEGNIKRRGKDIPLSDTERFANIPEALNAEEQAKVDAYRMNRKAATTPYGDVILSSTLPAQETMPLSRRERKEQSKISKRQRESRLADAYPDSHDRFEAEDLYERDRKRKSMEKELRENKYFDPLSGSQQTITPEYRMQRRALQNIHRSLPASITRPEYMTYLQTPQIRGDQTDIGVDTSLAGYTMQTLPVSERNEQLWNLFKMVGVLNAAPVYDPRLTSVESAKRVYSDKDYLIFMWDGDKNVLTPGTVVILTRREQMNGKGEFIPAGSPVAIGGWTLSDATEKKSLDRLKNIFYYEQYPSSKDRRLAKRSDVIGAYFGTKELTSTPRGLKLISTMIRGILVSHRAWVPQKQRISSGPRQGSFIDVPTFLTLKVFANPSRTRYRQVINSFPEGTMKTDAMADVIALEGDRTKPDDDHVNYNNAQAVAHFKMGTPIFNTFVSWIAKLFFNMYICTEESFPFKVGNTLGTTAQTALAHAIAGTELSNVQYSQPAVDDPTTYHSRHYEVGMTGEKPTYRNEFDPMPTAHERHEALIKRNIHELWNKSYFDDTALNIILRDEAVGNYLEDYCATLPTANQNRQVEVWHVIRVMAHVILYHTMNAGLENYLDDVVGVAVNSTNYKHMFRRYLYAYDAMIDFNDSDACEQLLAIDIQKENNRQDININEFNLNTINTVSKKQWANVIVECKLSRRGYSWVGKSKMTDPTDRLTVATAQYYQDNTADRTNALANSMAMGRNPLPTYTPFAGVPAPRDRVDEMRAFQQQLNQKSQARTQSRAQQRANLLAALNAQSSIRPAQPTLQAPSTTTTLSTASPNPSVSIPIVSAGEEPKKEGDEGVVGE